MGIVNAVQSIYSSFYIYLLIYLFIYLFIYACMIQYEEINVFYPNYFDFIQSSADNALKVLESNSLYSAKSSIIISIKALVTFVSPTNHLCSRNVCIYKLAQLFIYKLAKLLQNLKGLWQHVRINSETQIKLKILIMRDLLEILSWIFGFDFPQGHM